RGCAGPEDALGVRDAAQRNRVAHPAPRRPPGRDLAAQQPHVCALRPARPGERSPAPGGVEGARHGLGLLAPAIALPAVHAERPQPTVALLDARRALRQQLTRMLDRGLARDRTHHETLLRLRRELAPIAFLRAAISSDVRQPVPL